MDTRGRRPRAPAPGGGGGPAPPRHRRAEGHRERRPRDDARIRVAAAAAADKRPRPAQPCRSVCRASRLQTRQRGNAGTVEGRGSYEARGDGRIGHGWIMPAPRRRGGGRSAAQSQTSNSGRTAVGAQPASRRIRADCRRPRPSAVADRRLLARRTTGAARAVDRRVERDRQAAPRGGAPTAQPLRPRAQDGSWPAGSTRSQVRCHHGSHPAESSCRDAASSA